MKKILLIVSLFAGLASSSQSIPGYTRIYSRYEWLAGKFVDGLHMPVFNDTPYLKTGVWPGSGGLGLDSVLHRPWYYSGGQFRPFVIQSDLTSFITAVTATAPLSMTSSTNVSTSMATDKLIGRYDPGTGVMQQIGLGSGFSVSGGTLNYTESGLGTVTNVSVVNANGFNGSVANSSTTPAITLLTTVSNNQVITASSGALTGSNNFTFDGSLITHLAANLGTTQVDTKGFLITNTTAATSGNQQISPALYFSGRGFGTSGSSSQAVSFRVYDLPVQGTSPTGILKFQKSINGGAYADVFSLGSAGEIFTGAGSAGTAGQFIKSGGDGAAWSWSDPFSLTTTGSGAATYIGGVLNIPTPSTSYVTSVGLSLPGEFSVTNSPVTSTGTLTGAWANQSAFTVFRRASGTGVPSFGTIDTTYIASFSAKVRSLFSAGSGLSYNEATGQFTNTASGTVTSVSGTTDRITVTNGTTAAVVDIASTYVGQTSITTLGTIGTGTWQGTSVKTDFGGTGITSYSQGDLLYYNSSTALSKLAKSTTANQFLSNGGTNNNPSWATITAAMIGSGAALTVNDDTNIDLSVGGGASAALLSASSITAAWVGTLSATRGGTGTGTVAVGDLLYGSATNTWSKLAAGANGKYLKLVSGIPSWEDGASGISDVTASDANGFVWTITGTTTKNLSLNTNVSDGQLMYSNSGAITGSANNTFNGNLQILTANSLGTTQVNSKGFRLTNTTAAAAGAQQISPALQWYGQGWKTNSTAASQSVAFQSYVLPVQGAANPSSKWLLESSINGSSYTGVIGFGSGGDIYSSAGSAGTPGQLLTSQGPGNPWVWTTEVFQTVTNEDVLNALKVTLDQGGGSWKIVPGTGLTGVVSGTSGNGVLTLSTALIIESGTDSPTYTGVSNITGLTGYATQWSRVGNTVTVSGRVDADLTGGGTTRIGVTFPIVSNITNANECAGAAGDTGAEVAMPSIAVRGDTSNDRAEIVWQSPCSEGCAVVIYYTYTYQLK